MGQSRDWYDDWSDDYDAGMAQYAGDTDAQWQFHNHMQADFQNRQNQAAQDEVDRANQSARREGQVAQGITAVGAPIAGYYGLRAAGAFDGSSPQTNTNTPTQTSASQSAGGAMPVSNQPSQGMMGLGDQTGSAPGGMSQGPTGDGLQGLGGAAANVPDVIPVGTPIPDGMTAVGTDTATGGTMVVPDGAIDAGGIGGSGITGGQLAQGGLGALNVYQGIDDGNYAQAGVGAAHLGAALGNTAAQQVAGPLGAAYGGYQMIDNFGQGGAGGRMNGAMSGAGIGMYAGGPVGAAVGAVIGAGIGSIKTGKSKEQGARDAWRDGYEQAGVFVRPEGMGHQITLADGSLYDVGTDGKDGRAQGANGAKTFHDTSLMSEETRNSIPDKGEMLPYNIDFTNDLDMMASVSVDGLNTILSGGKNKGESGEAGQMGGYMTNAAVSNVGSREFNQDTWAQSMENTRGFYQQAGIDSPETGYAALSQMLTDGLITEEQAREAHHGIQMAFGDPEESWALAQELNSTRWEGVGETNDQS